MNSLAAENTERNLQRHNKENLSSQIAGLFSHVSNRRKIQFLFLLLLTLFSSVAEVISLGAVIPFIGILTQPETVFDQPQLQGLINWLNVGTPAELVLPLTVGFALASVIAGGLRLALLWTGIRLGNAIGADLGIKIFQKTLHQPYSVHISRHTSEIISVITQKVTTATSVLISLVTFTTSFVLFAAILTTMVIVDPFVAILAFTSFGIAYLGIAFTTRRKITENSRHIADEQTRVVRALQEGLGAIRDVLLNNAQSVYSSLYHNSILKLQKARGGNTFINQAPRFVMEALGLVLIAFLAYAMSIRDDGVESAIPLLGLLALGAQRLLPLMQQIYGNWSVLTGSKASLEDVLGFLEEENSNENNIQETNPLTFTKQITFKNVDFRYTENTPTVLRDINLNISKGERIGIIGSTGSGKSTLLDILMALIEPSNGDLLVDGVTVNPENRKKWQNLIAHVPQHIFLSDASFLENIAFGIPAEKINRESVKTAAKYASIAGFIESRKAGYDEHVGERGVRISGGERQRIGIARALYRKAEVLVFDEATSALDTDTEAEVMKAIENLSQDLTVFIIAHRLSTLRNCTKIIELDQGEIARIGSFDELIGK